MKNINFFRSTLAVMAFGFITLLTLSNANAQGRYVGQYSKANVDDRIRQLEDASDEFRSDFRRELDRSNLSNSQKNTYRRQVDSFENATDRLRSHFNSQNNWWNSRSQVQSMVSSAQPLNNTMNMIGFRRNIERQWNRLRQTVNNVADTYDLPGIAGGGWNGGGPGGGGPGWGGGGGTITPPSWAQGTFYGFAPNGSQISLTIGSNGSVNANVNGGISYGTFTRGNVLNINGNTSRVTRQRNGLVTTSTSNGERIVYSRTAGPGWGGGGGVGNPPSWAVGRFRANSPQGGTIIMNVNRNGSVTVTMGNNNTYGTLRGSTLSIDGNTANVVRDGNGFRTVSTYDGQTIYYRRY